jgi:sulfhydrogenase subunit gamma (sulfur reductase)
MEQKQGLPLVIRQVQDQGREIRSFDMAVDEKYAGNRPVYRPGQVAILAVPGEQPAYFAFASAPEDAELQFLIKKNPGPSARIYEMSEGDRVDLLDVVGSGFPLDEQKGKDLVFVAMGTGVAPLRSALRHALLHKSEYGQLVVLYGARTPEFFCYSEEIDHWEDAGVELRRVISRPDGHDWSGPTGYVQSLLDHVLPDLRLPVALVCGSREMIDQTRERLEKMGFAAEDILTNY